MISLRQAIRGVRDAQRLVREGEKLLRQCGIIEPPQQQATARRVHGAHAAMVESYRLERDAQVRYAESLACGDEDYRPVTFKEWLRDSGQERRAIRDDEWAAEWAE